VDHGETAGADYHTGTGMSEPLRIGDHVVYGPDPRAKGFTLDPREVGRVVGRYENAGVEYAKIAYGMRTARWRIEDLTRIEQE